MVFGLVSSIGAFLKVRFLGDKAVIDNVIFRFHYRVTSAIFFLFCILCTANSFLGPAIDCINDGKSNEHVINTYCWVMSTFTLEKLATSDMELGTHVAHQGVGAGSDDPAEKRYHAYYQWVPFVLFLQGILFYFPHWLWKNWEGGKIRMISDGLRGVLAETRDGRTKIQARLVRYLVDSLTLHNMYASVYFCCEVLNFINVIGNIFLTNKLLGGSFLSYGIDAITKGGDKHYNEALSLVFPRVTKCTFYKYGPSGTIQTHDSMCVLALNIINEKIFLFLWFWFIILAICTGLGLVYSLTIMLVPQMRKIILERRFKFRTPQGAETLLSRIELGDFLLLHFLGQNMNTVVFGDLLNDMARELNDPRHNLPPGHMEMAPIYPSKDLYAH